MTWLDEVRFDDKGLIPVIAEDNLDKQILMVAWMNRESLELTVEKNQAVYWSRSRQKLWHKGETSGHFQKVHDIYLDCDADVIVLSVTQVGGIACHTGRRSCFYRKLVDGQWQVISPVIKNPEDIYNNQSSEHHHKVQCEHNHDAENDESFILHKDKDTLTALAHILEQRKSASADTSYVASLYAKGLNKILEKVGEEATETIIAAKDMQLALSNGSEDLKSENAKRTPKNEVIYEVADLWFHTMVMLSEFNIAPQAVLTELARRFNVSGLDEKASR